jgi:acetyltransferase-like isoleucine patch superfamily enzyme
MLHPTVIIESLIPESTNVWAFTHIGKNVIIGENCTIGEHVYIGDNVVIGDRCRIQNGALIYKGVKIGNDVLIAPGVVTTNDYFPTLPVEDWSHRFKETTIEDKVSIGANATIICGVTIREGTLIGAGSVVTKSTQRNSLYYGNPARFKQYINDRKDTTTETLHCPD